jgi:hypothetical protein
MHVESVDTASSDILWGAKRIGQELGLNERQTYHRLEAGQIPGARKFGASWAVSREALRRLFLIEVE